MDSYEHDNSLNKGHEDDAMSAAEAKRQPRDALFMLAALTFESTGKTVDARVRNISSGGMLVQSNIFCVKGDSITADLRNIGSVKGRISWREGNHFGVTFDKPISPDDVRFKKTSSGLENQPSYLRSFEEQHAKKDSSTIRRV